MMKDLYHSLTVKRAIAPQTVGTTGTGRTGVIIDRGGYNGVMFSIGYGAITATNAVFTPLLKEGDVTGTLTSVADADMIGTEFLAGIAAGTPRASGVNMNMTKKLGYIGAKRYVQLSLKSTVTAGTPIHADAIMDAAEKPAA